MTIPRPTWRPQQVEDPQEVAECMKTYTDHQRAFVVYQYGTVVFSNTAAPVEDALYNRTLSHVINESPEFRVIKMKDRNLMVRFSGPVCGMVFETFLELYEEELSLKAQTEGYLPGEQIMAPENEGLTDQHLVAGLFARAKLYLDVESPQIKVRFTPDT